MTDSEKTTMFGATIEPRSTAVPSTTPQDPYAMTPAKSLSSLRDAPPTPNSEHSHDLVNPFDNFYKNNNSSRATSALKQEATIHTHDLESQRDLGLARTGSSQNMNAKEDSMWPSPRAQKEQAKQAKCAKSWNPMNRLGRRQKLVASLVIALLIIGAAVGVGVGVSKAVGGGVNKMNGGSQPIGDNNRDAQQ